MPPDSGQWCEPRAAPVDSIGGRGVGRSDWSVCARSKGKKRREDWRRRGGREGGGCVCEPGCSDF
jgi:hypothetical protein